MSDCPSPSPRSLSQFKNFYQSHCPHSQVFVHSLTMPCNKGWIAGADPNWREHWMPCVFWLPRQVHVSAGQELLLWSNNDDYRLWFDLSEKPKLPPPLPAHTLPQPVCACGMHLCLDEGRIWLLNDTSLAQ